MRPDGLLDLLAAPIDAVVVEGLTKDIQFDVAMRLIGTVQDFEEHHLLQVMLSDPQLEQVGVLEVPIAPRSPKPGHIPGYEINHNIGVRIDFEADQYGGYDLSFALDGYAQHRHKTTISVVEKR
ncbi:MAG: hypothetical protein MSC31_14210 [Solirubrobacteraceae bacterium MAG38_C4-C5]|nr:hypothetical protein [Candidatus Siliceabacter maunaloa]